MPTGGKAFHKLQREPLPNNLNVSFTGQIGHDLLARMPGVAASAGAACHAASVSISPVLQAMQLPTEQALGAIRFSLGRGTTREELDQVIAMLIHNLTASPTR